MRHRIFRFTGFAVAILGCSGAIACNSLELEGAAVPPAEEVGSTDEAVIVADPLTAEEQTEIARDNARPRCREGVGEGELSIRWAKVAAGSQARVLATVHNSGNATLTAEPVLIASNPSLGEVRERRLDAVTVAPGADVVVPVDVADFPVQTVGEASSVSIGLRWRRSDVPESDMPSPQALSQELYVTHDDDSFKTAVLRDVHEEFARQSTALTQRSPLRLTAVRALNRVGVLQATDPVQLSVSIGGLAVPEAATTTNIERRQP